MSKSRFAWVCVSLIAGGLCLAVALVIVSRRASTIESQTSEVARLQAENQDLRSRAGQLSRQIETLQHELEIRSAAAEAAPRSGPKTQLPAGTLEAIRTLGQLKEKLAAAASAVEELRDRTSELEAELEKATEENRQLAARESETSEQLSGARGIIEAMRAELKGKDERLIPLQMSNKKLREDSQALRERISRITKWTAELEALNRRREAYLTNILRRYRDVTEQYRALGAQLDEPAETAAPTGAEISRIQNAISMTEEDLRQLSNLNAQAERLQRKISGQ